MPRLSDEEIGRVKRTVDLVALVRSRGVELKKHGSKYALFLMKFERTLAIAFTSCKKSSAVTSKSSKALAITVGYGLEATESSFAWTQSSLKCLL